MERPIERIHALDTLRATALLLGVLVHGSLAFLPGAAEFWFTHDRDPSAAYGLGFYVPHMFRMLLFFLIAGFFGRLALERLGTKDFAKDRLRRITLVLVAFWPIVFIGFIAAAIYASSFGGPRPPSPPAPAFTPDDFPLTHLWFLYVLTLCYMAALAARWVLQVTKSGRHLAAVGDRLVRVVVSPIGPALLAVPLAASLAAHQGWVPWFGIPTPDQSVYPNFAACVAFGSAFIVGWGLHRQPAAMQSWTRHWALHLVVAAGATAACLTIIGLEPSSTPATEGSETLVYAGLYALGGWSWTVTFVGFALRFFSKPSRVGRYLADASYWIYLMHLPLQGNRVSLRVTNG